MKETMDKHNHIRTDLKKLGVRKKSKIKSFHVQISLKSFLVTVSDVNNKWINFMPLFHQRIKLQSCRRPLIVGSLGKNGKKIDQWGGRQNRYEGLGLTTDRPQDAPGGPRQSLTGLGLRTD